MAATFERFANDSGQAVHLSSTMAITPLEIKSTLITTGTHYRTLSTRETAFEMSLLLQLDAEVLIGQLSYKQRAEIYNIKHGYDHSFKQLAGKTVSAGRKQ